MVHALLLLAQSPVPGCPEGPLEAIENVKVRIREKPQEYELDGVCLDQMERGTVREVSSSIGSWLITRGYADPEMRRTPSDEGRNLQRFKSARDTAVARPRRRSTD